MFDFISAKVIGVTTPVVDYIPTAEDLPAYCARVSNPENQKNFDTAAGLLKYCMRVGHWSVFDMSNIVIEIEAPRDIARQVLRHSSIKFQEFSQRYAEAQTFVIREARMQDTKNRQNSVELDLTNQLDFNLMFEWDKRQAQVLDLVRENYRWALDNDIAKECARVILPEGNTMSCIYANGTVRQWITYLKVRDDLGVTQKEHVDLARKVKPAIIAHFPFLEQLMEKQS
ncbi:FAD-dependent thymidylate synthase [Pseudomonas sp.]|uniref:FAD-dependent thymidylate synthase n=1 Tax=Pseudomonas sp. TaxID=306 RepID=UPI003FD8230F